MQQSQNASVSVSASHSVSDAVSNQAKRRIVSGHYTKLDALFPVYHLLTQEIALPRFFYYISALYNMVQLIVTSQWILMMEAYSLTSNNNGIINEYLAKIAFFIAGNENGSYRFIIFIVFSVVFAISIIMILLQYISYIRTRSFKKWGLYIIRFDIDFLIPITILPMSQFIGYLTILVIDGQNGIDVVYLVLTLIYVIVLYIFIYFSQLLISASPFLPMHDLGTWSTPVLIELYFATSVFLFLGGFIRSFQFWAKSLVVIIHLILTIFLVYEIYQFPFISLTFTKIIAATCSAMIFGDLTIFIYSIFSKFSYFFCVLLQFIAFVVTLFVSVPFMHRHKKRVTVILNDESTNDETYFQCNISQHQNRAVYFLHVGFTEMCDRFLDWSLIKFIANSVSSTGTLLECIRIVSFFPPESRLLNMLFNLGLSRNDLKIQHRFTLYQIERIKSIRQSSSSADVTEQLTQMVNMTNVCVDEVCNFWNRVPNSDTVFQYISGLLKSAQLRWLECLHAYPNNFRYREEYAKFLIDCKADFLEGVMQKYKATLIDQGYSFAKDRAFRNMVMNYPLYLKRKILDLKGNIIKFHQQRKGSSTNSTANTGSSTLSSSASTIDMELQESIARSMFRHARMRIAMQAAVDDRSSFALSMMKKFSYIAMLLQLVCAVAIVFLLKDMYQPRLENIRRTQSVNVLRQAIAYTETLAHLRVGVQKSLVKKYQILDEMCASDGTKSIFNRPMQLIQHGATILIRPTIENLMSEITQLAESGSDVSEAAAPFVKNIINMSVVSNRKLIGPSKTTIQTLVAIVYESLMMMSDIPDTIRPTPATLLESPSNLNQPYFDLINEIDQEDMEKNISIPILNRIVGKLNTFNKNRKIQSRFKSQQSSQNSKKTNDLDGFKASLTAPKLAAAVDLLTYDYYQQFVANVKYEQAAFDLTYAAFIANEEILVGDCTKQHNLYMLTFPIVLFGVTTIWTVFEFILFKREQKKLIELMRSVEEQAKEEASHIMVHTGIEDEEQIHTGAPTDGRTNKIFVFCFVLFVLLTLYALLLFGNIDVSLTSNETFRIYNSWIYCAGARAAMLYEGLGAITMALILGPRSGITGFTPTNFVAEIERSYVQFESAIVYNNALISGQPENNIPPCKGKDKELDHIQLDSQCSSSSSSSRLLNSEKESSLTNDFLLNKIRSYKETLSPNDNNNNNNKNGDKKINEVLSQLDKSYSKLLSQLQLNYNISSDNNKVLNGNEERMKKLSSILADNNGNETHTVHDLISCSSLTENFELVSSLFTKVASIIVSQDGISDPNYYVLYHAIIDHMSAGLTRSEEILYELAEGFENSHRIKMYIFLGAEIVCSILILVVSSYICNFFDTVFRAALSLLKRVPPLVLVSNAGLLDYVLARKMAKANDEMETARSIMHNSQDAIICISRAEIIEIVNAGVPQLLGYTPEQLLGQPLHILLAEESVELVDKQLSMMRQGQSSALTFDGHVKCLTDDETQVACHLIIIGMDEDGHNAANSFVIILRGEEALLQQQNEAEEAKKQSENLLFHILPRDIVVRLNRGECNISFSVPSASIIFIDIQRFSDYASALTPSQIMGHLSMLFEAFDNIIVKYNLLIKIKLIGDIYMAAAGLFTPDEPPQHHAEQTVRFALEALQELDEVNVRLSSSLQVRIGINSGGPLIAGVLGTDKPVFDIIGDPINIAARLQSTDIAGRIQISTGTYELISNLDFNIEKRGEVFLKGKGKAISYLISQIPAGSIGLTDNPSFSSTSAFVMASTTSGEGFKSTSSLTNLQQSSHMQIQQYQSGAMPNSPNHE